MTIDDGVALIRRYYELFNARRIHEASALVADGCRFEHPATRMRALGPGGYRAIIDEWLTAFPDTQVTVVRIESSGEHRFRANLITRGHRDGILEVAPGITVPGDQQPFEVTVVHEFEIRDGKIAAAVALFDRDDLVGGKPRYRGGDPPG